MANPTKLSAREMTAEIDRATDRELGLDKDVASVEQERDGEARRVEARVMGEAALNRAGADFGINSNMVENWGQQDEKASSVSDFRAMENDRVGARNGEMGPGVGEAIVKEMVAAENGYAESELAPGANVIGAESKLEIKEREQQEREQFKIETGSGWEHDILTRSQERLTDKTVEQIHHVIKEKASHPAELEKYRHLGMVAILKSYNRMFGGGN